MTIKFEPGTVYDVAHLRPFDLGMALAGHPLAYEYRILPRGIAVSVRCFRAMAENLVTFDAWIPEESQWRSGGLSDARRPDLFLRLAPLAIRDGRPLHVGDEIEVSIVVSGGGCEWAKIGATIKEHLSGFYKDYADQWRWPESKA